MFQGINVVSISVTDMDAGRTFYRDVLEFGEPAYDLPDAGWVEFTTGGAGNISLVPAPAGWTPSMATTIVLNVADCHEAVAALRAKGATCGEPQIFPGFVTFADVYDPFGNRLQMCSPAPD